MPSTPVRRADCASRWIELAAEGPTASSARSRTTFGASRTRDHTANREKLAYWSVVPAAGHRRNERCPNRRTADVVAIGELVRSAGQLEPRGGADERKCVKGATAPGRKAFG